MKFSELAGILQRLLIKPVPIRDTAVEATDMDEVEGIWCVKPFVAAVIHFELNIRWHEIGLDWGEIRSDHLRHRVLIRKITERGVVSQATVLLGDYLQRPNTRPRANVKDTLPFVSTNLTVAGLRPPHLWVFCDRGEE